MTRHSPLQRRAARFTVALLLMSATGTVCLAADPYASNHGPYRTLNFDYPAKAPANTCASQSPLAALSTATAPAYVARLKKLVEPAMRDMIDKPDSWSPQRVGWYDMPWQAESGASGGREAILASFAGQVLPPGAFTGLNIPMQNQTVVYYDALSASMLKKLWANPFNPDRKNVVFPEGAMVVEAAAVTATPEQRPVLQEAAVWNVWRPALPGAQSLLPNSVPSAEPTLLALRVLQFDIIVKDKVASPQTGWAFNTFSYKQDAPGSGTGDKLVPLGAQWGNDSQLALSPSGDVAGRLPAALQEAWINPATPAFSKETLGWDGRLSGPIDLAKRHDVIFTDGVARPAQRSSSCMGRHGTAQYPFIANLYPSPSRSFPPDGSPFLLYPPGSGDWAKWFQNKPGKVAQNQGAGTAALDHDRLIMLALAAFDAASGGDSSLQQRIRAH